MHWKWFLSHFFPSGPPWSVRIFLQKTKFSLFHWTHLANFLRKKIKKNWKINKMMLQKWICLKLGVALSNCVHLNFCTMHSCRENVFYFCMPHPLNVWLLIFSIKIAYSRSKKFNEKNILTGISPLDRGQAIVQGPWHVALDGKHRVRPTVGGVFCQLSRFLNARRQCHAEIRRHSSDSKQISCCHYPTLDAPVENAPKKRQEFIPINTKNAMLKINKFRQLSQKTTIKSQYLPAFMHFSQ